MEPIRVTDTVQIIKELQDAIDAELLAAYQYWAAYQISSGPGKYDADDIFEEHAEQEWEPVKLLTKRFKELGGSLRTDLYNIPKPDKNSYALHGVDVRSLSRDIQEAEDRAVVRYTRLTDMTRTTDPATYLLASTILSTELEHQYEIKVLVHSL